MASKLLLTFLLLTSLVTLVYSRRGSFEIGNMVYTHLIYYDVHEKYGMPLSVRHEDIFIEGVENERIEAVLVQDLKGNSIAFIKDGGIGARNVTIRLESGVQGEGYKFLVSVFAF